jgi:hypothetical protein
VAGNTVCDVKVMEDFGSSFECVAFRIEWTIKLVMLGVFLLWLQQLLRNNSAQNQHNLFLASVTTMENEKNIANSLNVTG